MHTKGGHMSARKVVVFLAIIFYGTCTALAQDTWVPVSSTLTHVFEVRAGSFEFAVIERTNEPIAAIIVRARELSSSKLQFEKNYVRLSDCRAGFGKLVATDLNGRAKYDNDFIFDGGNVSSTIAETLCALAAAYSKTQPGNITPGRSF
jgi:hypothetical protein